MHEFLGSAGRHQSHRLGARGTLRALLVCALLSGCSRCGDAEPPPPLAKPPPAAVRRTATRPRAASATPSAATTTTPSPELATTPSPEPESTASPDVTATASAALTTTAPEPSRTAPRLPTGTVPAPLAPVQPLGGAPDPEPTEEPESLCDDRSGGALITFSICGETMEVWSTSGPFIDEALALVEEGDMRIPAFGALVDGTDCDPRWTWHPASGAMEFADATIEVCSGCPSQVENDKRHWFETVRQYCPWTAQIVAVDDRRGF